jgi:DNA-binding NarL/FixJ family response regulator
VKQLRILVVDDQGLFREALVRLIASQTDMEVVAQAGNGREAVELVRLHHPDIVLLDIRMPVMNGLEATRLIKTELPQTKVLILTVSDAEKDLFEALKNGAEGYLLKSIKADTLFRKIRDISMGETALSPILASRVFEEFARLKRHDEARSGDLSPREKEILDMVAAGGSNKDIADHLCLAEATVKRHLHNILQKLHAHNRAEAAAFGVRTGLVDSTRPPST